MERAKESLAITGLPTPGNTTQRKLRPSSMDGLAYFDYDRH